MRGQRVTQTVKAILESKRDDLEVVVSDNASEDETLELLSEINDDRLKVFRNDQNYGPIANFQIALARGRGKYVFLHSDEDIIITEELPKFIDFLNENPSIHTGIVSSPELETGKENRIFDQGRDSQLAAASGFTYLGGFFYKRAALELDFLYPEYEDSAFLYPFENLAWKLSQNGSFCRYSPIVFKRGRNEKSYFPKYEGRHFNHPSNLIMQYLKRCACFSDLATVDCTEDDKKNAFSNFRNLMMRQNFFLCYRQPQDEKLEILNLVQRFVPEISSHFVIKSLMAQVIGEQLYTQGNSYKAAEWYREAVEQDGRNAEAGFRLADIATNGAAGLQPTQIYQHIIKCTPKRWAFLLHIYAGFKQRNLTLQQSQVKELLEAEETNTPHHILKTLH
jgi:glycosyltransferase involved in cell wall biosynthesis